MKLKIIIILLTFSLLCGCQTRAPATEKNVASNGYMLEALEDPDGVEIPNDFNSDLFGVDSTLLSRDEAAVITRLEYLSSLYNFDDPMSIHAFLETVYAWIDKTYVVNEYGDTYITATSEEERKVVFLIDKIEIPIEFGVDYPLEDYPENVLDSDDWRVIGHRVGFSPTDYMNIDNGTLPVIKRLFSTLDAYKDFSKVEQIAAALEECAHVDMTVDVFISEVVFHIDGYNLHLEMTEPDKMLRIGDKRLVNHAFPTDDIDKYQIVFYVPDNTSIAVLRSPKSVTMTDKQFKKVCKSKRVDDLAKVNKVVRDVFKHIFAAWDLFTDETRHGFYVSVTDYLDSVDMQNGLYNCVVEDLTQSQFDPYFAISVSHKGTSYELHMTGDQYYLMIMEE